MNSSSTQQITLKSGLSATIRVLTPDDKEKIVTAFSKLEAETTYTRFFSYRKALSEAELDRACSTDFVNRVALAAFIQTDAGDIIIGAASYSAHDTTDGARIAEVAFTIEEDYHGQGLASIFLKTLIELARQHGISRLEADVLASNAPMLAVFRRCGLPTTTTTEDGVIHLEMNIANSAIKTS